MAVAYVTHTQGTPGTGSSGTAVVTVSGTNPHISVKIALHTTTVTVSSVTSSQSTGTIVLTKSSLNTNSRVYVYSIPAPAVATHTITVTLSGSADYNITATVFSGADQTTPQPAADAQASTSNGTPQTLTPTNLTANDASDAIGGNNSGNWSTVTTNQRVLDNVSAEGAAVGDSTGTTGVTFTNDGGVGASDVAIVAVRIAAASGGGGGSNNAIAWITA